MAMRQTPRSSGTGTPRRPPRTPVAVPSSVYEDFRPTIEWQEDEESNTLLLIHLPGFQRENLKVSTEGRNILRARGETLIAGNKWSRFQEDYPLPEDCNVRGIRAKFEAGILTIIIPKKRESPKEHAPIVATKPATEPSQKPQENLPAPQSSQKQPAAPQKTQQDAGSSYIAGPNGLPSAKKARMPAGITQETPADEHSMSTEKEDPKKSSKDQPEDSDYKKEAIEKTTEKWNDQKVTKADDGADKRPRPLIKKSEEPSSDYPKGIQKSEQGSDYHQKTTDAQEIKKAPDQVKDTPQETKEKQKLEKKDDGEILEPKERKTTTPTAVASNSRDYKQTVRKFLDLNEERQLLVNVGAAVLVIVAFGAYLSYTIS